MKKVYLLIFLGFWSLSALGQFGPENDITETLSSPQDVVLADIDLDGDLDIICAAHRGANVCWYENLGAGTFGKQQVITRNALGANAVFAVDIDGDGDIDLLSASGVDDKIAIYENLGNSTFGVQNIISNTADQAEDVCAADIDNDGDLDIISASAVDDKIAWYENFGGFSFGSEQIISNSFDGAWRLFTADIDNDSDIDVVAGGGTFSQIVWFENQGSGIFTGAQIITTAIDYVYGLIGEDLDGDGDVDILSASRMDDKVAWYENLGSGIFSSQNIISNTLNWAYSVYTDDLDNDGDLDVLSVAFQDDKVVWYENLGLGAFGPEQLVSDSVDGVNTAVSGDLDGDGFNDVISISQYDYKLSFTKNMGFANSFASQYNLTGDNSTPGAWSVFPADVDNDNDIDLLITSVTFQDKVAWFENLGSGVFGDLQIISLSLNKPDHVIAEDLDLDGDLDVIVASYNDDKVVWFENSGSGIFGNESILSSNSIEATYVATADLDGDGDAEILAASQGDDKIVWFENLGSGLFGTEQLVSDSAVEASSVAVADIDGDGDIDIVSSSGGDDKVAWYENLGGGLFGSEQIITLNADRVLQILTVDVNGDGNIDVISVSPDDTKIAWYENLGSGNFGSENIISITAAGPVGIHANDLDTDGDFDIIVASWPDHKIMWLENLGSGNFGSLTDISSYAELAVYVTAADLDGDGDSDVISTSFGSGKLAWYENYFGSNFKLSGSTYYDLNQNSVFDSLDYPLSTHEVFIQPKAISSYSSANGSYFFALDSGSYNVSFTSQNNYWNLITDSTSYTRNINSVNPHVDSLDFGFFPDSVIAKIEPELIGGFPRCNRVVSYWLSVKNVGTTIASGVIQLQLDDSITFISSSISPDSSFANNYYWNYDSLLFTGEEIRKIQVLMPNFNSLGYTMNSVLNVNVRDLNGVTIFNASSTLAQIASCAYDPNDKSAWDMGAKSNVIISDSQQLEYLIRFQNTGNDTAFTVTVRDLLDADLDRGSFKLLSSSHDLQTRIEQDGEIVFLFENILLPDSNINEPESNGYVKFAIKPKIGLSPQTRIENTAHIYFDDNPPIRTNTVVSFIECDSLPTPIINLNQQQFSVVANGSFSYQWYLNDTLIAGAISDTLVPFSNGYYIVKIIDSFGCESLSMPYLLVNVGLNEYDQAEIISYPNPADEFIYYKLLPNDENRQYEYELYSSNGRTVFTKVYQGTQFTVPRNALKSGLYFYRIIGVGGGIYTGKVVFE